MHHQILNTLGHLAVLAFLLSPVPASADFAAGVAALDRGDFATALTEFSALAEEGNPKGYNGLGVLYWTGLGVAKDEVRAAGFYRKSAHGGYRAGQYNLGGMYEHGLGGVRQDYSRAVMWYRKAAEQGYAPAELALGSMYEAGRGVPTDYEEAVQWYRKAAEQGDHEARFNLERMYRLGRGVAEDGTKTVP